MESLSDIAQATQAMRRVLLLLACCLASVGAWAQPAGPDALRTRFAAAVEHADRNVFDRPIYLQSTDTPERQQADVYAEIDYPYGEVLRALTKANQWCGILILHLNVKYCRASGTPGHDVVDMAVGRKAEQALPDAYWVSFGYRVANASETYLNVLLEAATGPLSTKDYHIQVEAVPLTDRRSLLHMTYAYSSGMAARWAMQAYLATAGSAKVGFSFAGQDADGQPRRIGGLRGLLERNTMRYYLAIESYLGAQAAPAEQQLQKSLQDWFSATEKYPRQLHEMDHDAYIAMKLHEVHRQETEAPQAREN